MKYRYTIGSGNENDVVYRDPYVSSQHARIELQPDGRIFIEDFSTNGTYVRGILINKERVLLFRGDTVEFSEQSKLDWKLIGKINLITPSNRGIPKWLIPTSVAAALLPLSIFAFIRWTSTPIEEKSSSEQIPYYEEEIEKPIELTPRTNRKSVPVRPKQNTTPSKSPSLPQPSDARTADREASSIDSSEVQETTLVSTTTDSSDLSNEVVKSTIELKDSSHQESPTSTSSEEDASVLLNRAVRTRSDLEVAIQNLKKEIDTENDFDEVAQLETLTTLVERMEKLYDPENQVILNDSEETRKKLLLLINKINTVLNKDK
jgi:hypothetical protein